MVQMSSREKCPDCGWLRALPGEKYEAHAPGCSMPPRQETSPRQEPSPAEKICLKAAALVGGDRARQHGDKQKNFQLVADFWSVYLGVKVTAAQVPMMMALLKVARTKGGSYNPDDYLDLVGYGGCAGEVAENENKLLTDV